MDLDEIVNAVGIEPSYKEEEGILYCADNIDVLRKMPSDSIDLIVTDPPYGMSFMGKRWDKAVPKVEVWEECLRVLKSGAFAFIMCIPRQDCLSRMIVNLQEAGFDTGFTSLYWAVASGFPKASDVAMLIDKRACKKELTEKLGRKPTKDEFKEAWKEFREVISIRRHPTLKSVPKVKSRAYHVETLDSDVNMESWNITVPKTPHAKALEGAYCGAQFKPAIEIVIVAMKPLSEKSYTDQALKDKKGITWLDDKTNYAIIDYKEIKQLRGLLCKG